MPVDLKAEKKIDPEITQWLAFAQQKLEELAVLKTALTKGRNEVAEELAASTKAAKNRRSSPRIHNEAVAKRLAAVTPDMAKRQSPYPVRAAAQQAKLNLPLYPTTTIGSFPQTSEVRQARAKNRRGELDNAGYTQFLREQTAATIRWQEESVLTFWFMVNLNVTTWFSISVNSWMVLPLPTMVGCRAMVPVVSVRRSCSVM